MIAEANKFVVNIGADFSINYGSFNTFCAAKAATNKLERAQVLKVTNNNPIGTIMMTKVPYSRTKGTKIDRYV